MFIVVLVLVDIPLVPLPIVAFCLVFASFRSFHGRSRAQLRYDKVLATRASFALNNYFNSFNASNANQQQSAAKPSTTSKDVEVGLPGADIGTPEIEIFEVENSDLVKRF